MKKYITFDSIAYAMSLATFLFIAVMLCAACMNLQERANQNKEMEEAVNAMFLQLDKPL